ncbi:MAG: hypothetical protein FWG22_00180, partial [Prolixibacteraceae bacterium]|nr:hypothetical protein [Prolixibacteraceae bacterium]
IMIGIYQYIKAQKWKKAEFVSKEIKEFYNDFDIKRAFTLLDWNSNELVLKENELDEKKKIHFTDDLIFSSLALNENKGCDLAGFNNDLTGFSKEEVVIRGIFDSLLGWLIMFNSYIETKLVTAEDLRPYLIYWIQILADADNNRKPEKVRKQIWKYIDANYGILREFCGKFGFKHIKT